MTENKLEHIANLSTRSEKTSWNRKLDNMVKLMAQLTPIEDRILDIIHKEKQPLMDEIAELRKTMINECIHPLEQLIDNTDHVVCKFCERRFSVIKHA